jgi:glycosyl transferase family 87
MASWRFRFVASLLPLGIAFVYFAIRGPMRAWLDLDGHDLPFIYVASRAWLQGVDPYDGTLLAVLGAGTGVRIGPGWSLHPPTTYLLVAPFAALPWPLAEKVAVVANVVLEVATIALAMSIARLSLLQPRGILFVAFALALAPVHTTISEGQLTIAVTFLIVAALAAEVHDRPALGGICIALAALLRPQMGLIFVVLLLVCGQRRAFVATIACLVGISAVAVTRLAVAGVDWLPTLMSNVAGSGVADATADTTQRLNLQALLNVVLAGRGEAPILVVTSAVGLAAFSSLVFGLRGRTDIEARLLAYAGCGVITLLTIYNRSYGATLLILPMAWAFATFRSASLRPTAVMVCVATAPFLVPGAAALAGTRPPPGLGLLDAWWPLLQLHQVIALLVVLAGILVAAVHPAVDRPPSGVSGTSTRARVAGGREGAVPPAIIGRPC